MKKLVLGLVAAMLFGFCAPVMAADVQNLSTRSGFEVGVQVSRYSYEETSLELELAGNKVGLTAAYTATFNQWFGKADIRLAYGKLRYSSPSGVMTGIPDMSTEARLVIGRDFFLGTFSVSPHFGVGYRYLSSDARGVSTSGAVGYRRYSTYYPYFPVGVTARVKADNGWVVVPNIEYDYFVKGTQKSMLTDTGVPGIPDIENNQEEGYGVRGSLMLEKGNWSFGPFFQAWRIKKSDIVRVKISGYNLGFMEPENNTLEYGVQAIFHF